MVSITAAEAGARSAFYTVIRLPWEVAPIFKEWLELHYPQRAARIMARVQEMRGGKDYDSAYGTRMRGEGPFADLIAMRFAKAYKRIGFGRLPALDCSRFVVPVAEKPVSPQGTLF